MSPRQHRRRPMPAAILRCASQTRRARSRLPIPAPVPLGIVRLHPLWHPRLRQRTIRPLSGLPAPARMRTGCCSP
ncbi:hypothetical protein F751_0554 [Auxenochlorella protothecoides]|uniref:Uncharacterized protein n=1 Tax=Auxenochlorella protothecoides TaxID=3075 RepID=A0A087SIH3_AUXPR|nr:hypothetical protein F751_0554 [Auxenochlorella protothecoides]KFM25527.1 hypothetical protein F751_0554 [Auxenochlorella protothecoides]